MYYIKHLIGRYRNYSPSDTIMFMLYMIWQIAHLQLKISVKKLRYHQNQLINSHENPVC
jgi:hypothetical protein